MTIAPARTTAHHSLALGLASSFIHRPVGLRVASPDPAGTTIFAVENSVSAHLLAAFGLSERLHATAAMPVVLFQEGAAKSDIIGSDDTLAHSAAGDLRLGVGMTLLRRGEESDGLALASRLEVTFPTGDAAAFVSYPSVAYAPAITIEHRLGFFSWSIEGSARIRSETQLATTTIGSQIGSSVGISFDILSERWLTASAEAFALFTLARQEGLDQEPLDPHIPAEWMVSARTAHLLDGRLRFSLGGGGGMVPTDNSPVTMPALRVSAAIHYLAAVE